MGTGSGTGTGTGMGTDSGARCYAPTETRSVTTERNDEPGFAPGTTFKQYTIVRRIGLGGMGAVYEALHVGLKKRVALKTLHAARAGRREIAERFLREGEAAARLEHPHAVSVFDVGVHDDVPFLVMEYLEGEDLGALLAREPVLPAERIAAIMLPVLSAVAAAHARGIVHRDLKPANIFLTTNIQGRVHPKLLDFGISKLIDLPSKAALTASGAMLGTIPYMSPEQALESRLADARSDQYALGVIVYECATGARPQSEFERDGNLYALLSAIVEARFEPPRARRPEIEPAFEAMILRAMQRDPDARFSDVSALGQAMYVFADADEQAAWRGSFGGPSPRPTVSQAPPAERRETLPATRAGEAHLSTVRASSVSLSPRTPREPSGRWLLGVLSATLVIAAGFTAAHLARRAGRHAHTPAQMRQTHVTNAASVAPALAPAMAPPVVAQPVSAPASSPDSGAARTSSTQPARSNDATPQTPPRAVVSPVRRAATPAAIALPAHAATPPATPADSDDHRPAVVY